MMNEKWANISLEDREAIDDAVRRNYYVSHDKEGNGYIELYADYNETNEFLLQTAYDHRNDAIDSPKDYEPEKMLMNALNDDIWESYEAYISETEDQILRMAGFDPSDDKAEEQMSYLRAAYPLFPPYDHFLDQTMRVNIMLKTPTELNLDFGIIRDQRLALSGSDELTDPSPENIREILNTDSSLKRLVEQQGYTMDQLAATMHDFIRDFYDPEGHPAKYCDANGKSLPYETRMDIFTAGRSKFLTSMCQELDNHTYSMGTITVMAEVTMKEFAEMMQPGKEITMPVDSNVGIFNPWLGCVAVMGVYLSKNMVFSREDIYDVQIEGAKLDMGCSLDSVCGYVNSAWKRPVSIQDKAPARATSLDDIIQSASSKKNQKEPTYAVGRGDEKSQPER